MAIGTDGDFVITWQSVVPNSVNPGSQSDIFARRLSASGWVQSGITPFEADMSHPAQTLTIFPTNLSAPVVGTFTFVTGKGTLNLSVTSLWDLANQLQAGLIGLGYNQYVTEPDGTIQYTTTVTVEQSTATQFAPYYELQIAFGAADVAAGTR